MNEILSNKGFKLAAFLLITSAIARATCAVALSRTWSAREWGIALMGFLTLVAGAALFEEIRKSKIKMIDPFGEEASGSQALAANLLREMDPAREEELISVLLHEQPEALNALRSGRVVFSDLPFHDSRVVKAALRECAPGEVAQALQGQNESLQACLRKWAGIKAGEEIPAGDAPVKLRRKILEAVESHYLQMGVHDFAARLERVTNDR